MPSGPNHKESSSNYDEEGNYFSSIGKDDLLSRADVADHGNVVVDTEKADIEIIIGKDLSSFTERDRENILKAIASILEIEQGEIRVKKIRPGSIRLTVEIPAEKAEMLLWAIQAGRLDSFDVLSAKEARSDQIEKPRRSVNQGRYRDEVYSKRVPTGKRTYFFDVKTTRSGEDYFLTITESKRIDESRYQKHKIFLYKEDFGKFLSAMHEVMAHIREEILPGQELEGDPSFDDEYLEY